MKDMLRRENVADAETVPGMLIGNISPDQCRKEDVRVMPSFWFDLSELYELCGSVR